MFPPASLNHAGYGGGGNRTRDLLPPIPLVLAKIKGRAAYTERYLGHDTPCWIWNGSLNSRGYALRCIDKRVYLVHRVLTEAFGSEQVHHLCEQKACVRPDHLRVTGSAREHSSIHVGGSMTDRVVHLVRCGVTTRRELMAATKGMPGEVSMALTRAIEYGDIERVGKGRYAAR